jgi:hypothetical protein
VVIRRGQKRVQAELGTLLASEGAVRGPEPAIYRSGSGPYPKVKGNGRLVLTAERLKFAILVGKDVDIPVSEITGVREDVWFQRSMSGGKSHLIVQTAAGEVGFFVADNAAWKAAIEGVSGRAPK